MPEITRFIWATKYRRRSPAGVPERSIGDTWDRVATALAGPEPDARATWALRFRALFEAARFSPGGRIIAGAATPDPVTLFNCFVLPAPTDAAFALTLAEAEVTMRQGGGIGLDMSRLVPSAPGVVARLHQLDRMCGALSADGRRRGAMMATLRCDHPEVAEFIDAKAQPGALSNFNLSVQVTDAFIFAVQRDQTWPLRFPVANGPTHAEARARALWERLLRAAYDTAEPGVLFIDRINALNNLAYCERIDATNPCGEVPLPKYGACDLGSLNIVAFVCEPFTEKARVDEMALAEATALGVRMLDNVIDISRFPLAEQEQAARQTRRIGLGIMGLADALVMVGLRYDSARARKWTDHVITLIKRSAYGASISLAREKGAFAAFDRDRYLAGGFVRTLPQDIKEAIARDGIRNSHLLAIAPTGSISLLAGGVSSGIEPVVEAAYRRTLIGPDGRQVTTEITAPSVKRWRDIGGSMPLPPAFQALADVAPENQLAMQAVLQPHVDNAISKTVTVAFDYPFARFRTLYERADALGLKGCAAYRPGGVRGSGVICSDRAAICS